MPRNISFFMTQEQVKAKTKTVTRRLGWKHAKAGDICHGIVKGQGLKKGEKVQRLATIRFVDVSFEPLDTITQAECALEGFPDLTPAQFVDMFCIANKCPRDATITRLEYVYLTPKKTADLSELVSK